VVCQMFWMIAKTCGLARGSVMGFLQGSRWGSYRVLDGCYGLARVFWELLCGFSDVLNDYQDLSS